MQVYCSNHYGEFKSEAATQYFNSWTTAVKLAWDCPRGTRTYLVKQVLACGTSSARTDIMARYSKFFRGLRNSTCREVAILANLIARDRRSVTGSNVELVSGKSGCNVWSESPAKVRAGLMENEAVAAAEQRQEWQYLGLEEEEQGIQQLVDSLCVN